MSRRIKKAVRKISSMRAHSQESDEENIPINMLRSRHLKEKQRAESSTIRPDFSIIMGNTYLFKNDNAYCNYIAFCKRPQTNCYYFIKKGIIRGEWENTKVTQYSEQWGWKPLLECDEPYQEVIVRAFYANISKHPKNQTPWGFTTYVCGREIEVTLPNLAAWLGLENDGEEIYLNKSWLKDPKAPTSDDYLAWFGVSRTVTTNERHFHVTILPSLHRLGYALITHILAPKGGKKTNVENNQMFYLRHLIEGSNRMFNIPFVIISHMLTAYNDSQRILPYGNVIARILKANGVDITQFPDLISPSNLWDHLTSYGWNLVQMDQTTGIKEYAPKGNPVDHWIAAPNALPNQYCDPQHGQPQTQADGGGSSSQPGYTNEFQTSVLEALANLSVSNAKLEAKCDQIIQTQTKHSEEIEMLKANYNGFNEWARGNYRNLYQDLQALKTRFVVRFGPDDDDDAPTPSHDGDGDDDPMQP